jgi:hypothetical protein
MRSIIVVTLVAALIGGVIFWDRSGRVTYEYWSSSPQERERFQSSMAELGYDWEESVSEEGRPVIRVYGMTKADSQRLLCDGLKIGPAGPSKALLELRAKYQCPP